MINRKDKIRNNLEYAIQAMCQVDIQGEFF